jgi:hypothetical protein
MAPESVMTTCSWITVGSAGVLLPLSLEGVVLSLGFALEELEFATASLEDETSVSLSATGCNGLALPSSEQPATKQNTPNTPIFKMIRFMYPNILYKSWG